MLTDISVTCPEKRRTNHRRNKLGKIWDSQEWKAFKELHTTGKVCVHCGYAHGEQRRDREGNPRFDKNGKPIIVKLTINHISRHKYRTVEEYLTWDDDCEVCCTTCNGMFERSMKPCPVCKVAYIFWRETECRHCYESKHPVEAKASREARERQEEIDRVARNKRARAFREKLNPHPCIRRKTEQRCSRRPGLTCDFTRAKASNCPYFRSRLDNGVKA